MGLLKHRIVIHPELVYQFAPDKPVTPGGRYVLKTWLTGDPDCPPCMGGFMPLLGA